MSDLILKINLISDCTILYSIISLNPDIKPGPDREITPERDPCDLLKEYSEKMLFLRTSGDQHKFYDTALEIRGLIMPEVLSDQLKSMVGSFRESGKRYLVFDIDPRLGFFPWEYLPIDRHYLDESHKHYLQDRFHCGRHLRGEGGFSFRLERGVRKFLIVANPDGTLPDSKTEANDIVETVKKYKTVLSSGQGGIRVSDAIDRIKEAEIFHFSGHSDFFSLELSDGELTSDSIRDIRPSPFLVMLNSCSSSSSKDYEKTGLARAFISNGSKIVIGTTVPVRSAEGTKFAKVFYDKLFSGYTVGKAMSMANKTFKDTVSPYRLYGNPSLKVRRNLIDYIKQGYSLVSDNSKRAIGIVLFLILIWTIISFTQAAGTLAGRMLKYSAEVSYSEIFGED